MHLIKKYSFVFELPANVFLQMDWPCSCVFQFCSAARGGCRVSSHAAVFNIGRLLLLGTHRFKCVNMLICTYYSMSGVKKLDMQLPHMCSHVESRYGAQLLYVLCL